MLFIMGEHMCEILHIAQHQHWMGLKQSAVWYVLLVGRRSVPSLILSVLSPPLSLSDRLSSPS